MTRFGRWSYCPPSWRIRSAAHQRGVDARFRRGLGSTRIFPPMLYRTKCYLVRQGRLATGRLLRPQRLTIEGGAQ